MLNHSSVLVSRLVLIYVSTFNKNSITYCCFEKSHKRDVKGSMCLSLFTQTNKCSFSLMLGVLLFLLRGSEAETCPRVREIWIPSSSSKSFQAHLVITIDLCWFDVPGCSGLLELSCYNTTVNQRQPTISLFLQRRKLVFHHCQLRQRKSTSSVQLLIIVNTSTN